MQAINTQQRMTELAQRLSDGVDVSLLWDRLAGDLTVVVWDSRAGDHFELPALPENALDVFNHPFAYAAFLGIQAEGEPALAAA